MNSAIRLEKLTEANFEIFEKLLTDTNEAGCYCSFWHGKIPMNEWKDREKCAPEKNRETTLAKIRSGFHVGVLGFEDSRCVGWIGAGPIADFYWTWRRLPQLSDEEARTTAAIVCININTEFRKKGYQSKLLSALGLYAAQQGWKIVEGYPFDDEAFQKQGLAIDWTGFASSYVKAGFVRVGHHWLSGPDYPRSIYRLIL